MLLVSSVFRIVVAASSVILLHFALGYRRSG